jgi:hypothetical protein
MFRSLRAYTLWSAMSVRMTGCAVFLLLLNGSSADATSIVIQVYPNRILVAADTRGAKLDVGTKSVNETECKIVPLGNAAFALSGNEDYVPTQFSDPVASWNSRSDAREAYAEQHGDLIATVDNWTARAKRHYSSFYFANPERVKQLAQANNQNVLLVGLFSGFQEGKAILLVRIVYLDPQGLQPILDKQLVLSARELPYTSNGITQDLIEGHSQRAGAANAAWLKKSQSIAVSNRALRRVEFLIQFTANYDETVGTRVNVLEIFRNKKPRWLQNFTCSSAN